MTLYDLQITITFPMGYPAAIIYKLVISILPMSD